MQHDLKHGSLITFSKEENLGNKRKSMPFFSFFISSFFNSFLSCTYQVPSIHLFFLSFLFCGSFAFSLLENLYECRACRIHCCVFFSHYSKRNPFFFYPPTSSTQPVSVPISLKKLRHRDNNKGKKADD